MVEMAYGPLYKQECSTVAINIVDAHLEQDLSQSPFDRNQDRFEMIRILNEERVEYSKGKWLDLEFLLNRLGSIFKPIEDEAPGQEDESLQAAHTAQIRKSEYRGVQAKNRSCPKPTQKSRPERTEQESDSRLTRLILDLKAEIAHGNGQPRYQFRTSSYEQ
jgi:hypothetical protein